MGCEEDKLREMKKMSLQERSLKYWVGNRPKRRRHSFLNNVAAEEIFYCARVKKEIKNATDDKKEERVYLVNSINRILLFYSLPFIVLCVSMYPSYHVLEFDPHRENCLLASVANEYLVWAAFGAFLGATASMLGFILSRSFPATPVVTKGIWVVACCLAALSLVCNLFATESLALFIGHSRQPAIAAMHEPLAGYHCPK